LRSDVDIKKERMKKNHRNANIDIEAGKKELFSQQAAVSFVT